MKRLRWLVLPIMALCLCACEFTALDAALTPLLSPDPEYLADFIKRTVARLEAGQGLTEDISGVIEELVPRGSEHIAYLQDNKGGNLRLRVNNVFVRLSRSDDSRYNIGDRVKIRITGYTTSRSAAQAEVIESYDNAVTRTHSRLRQGTEFEITIIGFEPSYGYFSWINDDQVFVIGASEIGQQLMISYLGEEDGRLYAVLAAGKPEPGEVP